MNVCVKQVSQEDGFTLLELLVAVAILALLAVPISGSIQLGLKSWIQSHKVAEEQERVFLVNERIKDWLKRAYPLDNRRTQGVYVYPLLGASDTIEFTAPAHPDPGQDSLYRVRLRVEGGVLQAGMLPDFSYLAEGADWVWTDLIKGVENLSLSYMAGLDASSHPVWSTTWGGNIDTVALPWAVRVNLDLLDSDLSWNELVVPLVIDEQAFCRFLPNERECLSGASVG